MTKRKMIILVVLAMTFTYMICAIISFVSIRNGLSKNFKAHRDAIYHDMNIYANFDLPPSDLVDLLDGSYNKTPKAFATYDPKGHIQSISSLSIEVAKTKNQFQSFVIDDEVVLKHFNELQKLGMSSQYVNVNEVSFYTLKGKKIVTSFSVGVDQGKKNFKKFKTIVLSSHKPDQTYTLTKSAHARQVYDMSFRNNISYMKKSTFQKYISLKNALRSPAMKKRVRSLYKKGFNGKLNLSANRFLTYVIDYEYQEKPYIALGILSADLTAKTLDSRLFQMVILLEAFLFFIVGGLIIIITNYYYEKGEELSEAELIFMNASAHELRTPITIISSATQLIEEGVNPQKNDQYFDTIKKGVNKMMKLVGSLLYYNGLYRKEKVSSKAIDLYNVIEECLDEKQELIKARHLNLEVKGEGPVMIIASREIMMTLVSNFVSNMINYAPDGGDIRVTIEKKWRHTYHIIFFNTHDYIDEKTLRSYWTAFKRERSDSSEGNGLGLAINKRILDIYHYPYHVKNVEGGIAYSFSTKPYSIAARSVGYLLLFVLLATLISVMLLGVSRVMLN